MAENNLTNLRTKISMDTVDFESSSQTVDRELKKLRSELKLVSSDTKLFGNDSQSLSNKMGVLEKTQTALNVKIKQSHDEYEKYRTAIQAGGKDIEQNTKLMDKYANQEAKARAELSRTKVAISELTTEMLRHDSALYQVGNSLENAGAKLNGWGTSIDKAANVWLKVSGAVVAAGGLLIASAVQWESSVASMAKTIDATPDQFDAMTRGIRDLALEIPTAASELAELASIGGQLGIDNENIVDFTKIISQLATTTNMTAETVASEFAKFANITNMAETNFSNLGSVVVDLGNNFSTVESDITAMAMRIAGAGETVGMTEAEIMGLAAAMSSLGIESEMGGSAISKLLVSMELASETGVDGMARLSEQTGLTRRDLELMASNSSKDFTALADSLGMTTTEMNDLMTANKNLENFAEIAGVSIEEFANKFNDPNGGAVAAMQQFIGGLKETGTEGASTIEKLDAMGITEIRMRDALLRLANGSGVLTDAISTANVAWDENTALQVEAEKRYATTESQLLLLKNKLMEVAISAGEQLLPALNKLVDSLDPLIESLTDGVKWFANLDGASKEAALKLAAFTIVGGPLLKVLSTTFKSLGDVTGGFGSFLKAIVNTRIDGEKLVTGNAKLSDSFTSLAGKSVKSADDQLGATLALKGAFSKLSTGAGELSIAHGTLATGVQSTTQSMGYFLTGLLSTPAGIAIAAAAIVGIGVALSEMKDDYDESKKQTENWGDDVDKATANALDDFKILAMEANNYLDSYNSGLIDSTDKVSSAYAGMLASIQEQGEEAKAEINETFDYLPTEIQEKLEFSKNQRLIKIDDLVAQATYAEEEITKVLETAETERRVLTEKEQARIEALQTQIANVQAALAAETAAQQEKIIGGLSTQIDNLNKDQLQSHFDMLSEQRRQILAEYDAQVAALESVKKKLSPADFKQTMTDYNREFTNATNDLVAAQVAALNELGGNDAEIAALLEGTGMSFTDAMARYYMMMNETADGFIEITDEMTAETQDASYRWNSLVWNPLTGEANSNIAEVVNVAVENTSTWNDLKFAMQYADLDTNTMDQIKQALIDNGKWNELSFEEQQAFIQTNGKQAAEDFMSAKGLWEVWGPEAKELWLETNSPAVKEEFMHTNGLWETLTWEQMELLLNTNSFDITQEFLEANGIWDSLSPEQKEMLLNTNAYATSEDFMRAYGQWDELSPEMKDYITQTNAAETQATNEEAFRMWKGANPEDIALNVTSNAYQTARDVTATLAAIPDEWVYVNTAVGRTYTATGTSGSLGVGYNAKGTNFHPGGYAVLGDGGKREPFLTPDGRFGISPASDTLYDLPRGSKVWSSIEKFKTQAAGNKFLKDFVSQLPHFAFGTQSSFLDTPKMPNMFEDKKAPVSTFQSNDEYNIYLTVNGDLPDATIRKMAVKIQKEIKNMNDRKLSSVGGVVKF